MKIGDLTAQAAKRRMQKHTRLRITINGINILNNVLWLHIFDKPTIDEQFNCLDFDSKQSQPCIHFVTP
jgi:hypothetical protein